MSTPTWMADAACTTREAQGLPWTTDTIEVPEVIVDLMRSTCDSCAVRLACNSYALEERVSGGMWAGSDRDVTPATPAVPKPDSELFPRATPIYGRNGELVDHQLVLFSWTNALGGAA